MQLFYEILPVFLFFIAFKFYGIYVATTVGIVATFIQVIATRVWQGSWDRKQLITLCVFLFFGGMTLYFHNPIFVKWKPTIVFWIFAIAMLGSHFFSTKTLTQRMMENMVEEKGGSVPRQVWNKLSILWVFFFGVLGAINLYVAYYFSNDAWVNFKFYGITAALFLFSIFQAIYLMRHLPESK
jgi:intracellular septation protein